MIRRGPIEKYLDELGRTLAVMPGRRREILREVRDHLQEAATAAAANGATDVEAELHAVSAFGAAGEVAQSFRASRLVRLNRRLLSLDMAFERLTPARWRQSPRAAFVAVGVFAAVSVVVDVLTGFRLSLSWGAFIGLITMSGTILTAYALVPGGEPYDRRLRAARHQHPWLMQAAWIVPLDVVWIVRALVSESPAGTTLTPLVAISFVFGLGGGLAARVYRAPAPDRD
jgi:hypothetical protein